MSNDRLINHFFRAVKSQNEGKLPEKLRIAVVVNGANGVGTFVNLHEGQDVLELVDDDDKPVMIRVSAIQVIGTF